jgi:hypothetical protein
MNSNGVQSSKHDLLMQSLQNFFLENPSNLQKLLDILSGESNISLRVIDWFVTNYSKKNNISYMITDDGQIIADENTDGIDPSMKYRQFVVYIDYKLQLKGYQKRQFDPFCRRSRIDFYYAPEKYIVTTIGQLNFFKWALYNKIIQYIEMNLKIIEKDMNTCYKAAYQQSKKSGKNTINNSTDSNNSTNSCNSDNCSNPSSLSANDVEINSTNSCDTSTDSSKSCRRKRQQLSISATKKLSKSNVRVMVSFD